jgi:DNA-binding transcriptional regulator YiaG
MHVEPRTNLERLRTISGLTEADLATAIGASKEEIALWQEGAAQVPDAPARRMASFFAVSVPWVKAIA